MSAKYFKTPLGVQTTDVIITGAISANSSIGAPGDVLTSNGTIAYWSAPTGGATNLSTTANATSYVVLSDTGTDAIISAANATTAGLVTSSTQTIAGSKTFSSPMTVSADTNINGYTMIMDHLSVVRSNTWTNGIGDDGDGAVGIYAQYTTGANSSTSVTGLFSFASLYTGIYNLTGTRGITGIDAYAQGYGSANSSVSKVTGLNTRVEENGNGKIIEGIGVNSEYYGNIDTYYGFKQNKLEFGTANTAYGIHSNLTASPTTFNFYAASNAYNYFGGNVGIGTTNPTEKLTILEGNARIIRTGGAKLQLADQIYEVSVESTPVGIASDMLFKTNVTERMRIDAAGNVGIGVSSPLEKLDVVGNIKLTGAINANGSVGIADQVLTSNGSVAYWSTPTGGSLASYSTNIGDASANTFTITHNLNKVNIFVSVRENSSGYFVYPDIKYNSANAIAVEFSIVPSSDQYYVSVIGA